MDVVTVGLRFHTVGIVDCRVQLQVLAECNRFAIVVFDVGANRQMPTGWNVRKGAMPVTVIICDFFVCPSVYDVQCVLTIVSVVAETASHCNRESTNETCSDLSARIFEFAHRCLHLAVQGIFASNLGNTHIPLPDRYATYNNFRIIFMYSSSRCAGGVCNLFSGVTRDQRLFSPTAWIEGMIKFVTTNPGKIHEAREYLDAPVEQLDFDYPERQADDLTTVAAHGARAAYRHAGEPVIVDDSGLTIDALGGFPGPYSSYVEDKLGIERVWELTENEDDRSAAFRAVIAYCDGGSFEATPEPVDTDRRGDDLDAEARATATTDEQVHTDGPLPVRLFEGVAPGKIVAPRGDGGFGFDPIFEYDGQTFAEMSTDEKNAVSHRGRALAKFAEWYASR